MADQKIQRKKTILTDYEPVSVYILQKNKHMTWKLFVFKVKFCQMLEGICCFFFFLSLLQMMDLGILNFSISFALKGIFENFKQQGFM